MTSMRGSVWLFWHSSDKTYQGYWDAIPDGPGAVLEQFFGSVDIETAVSWGRSRSDRVFIRPQWDDGTYYWAGNGPKPEKYDQIHDFPPERQLTL